MAASLDAPVLMVLDANSASGVSDLVTKALVSRNGLLEERAQVVGLIVNKVSFAGALFPDVLSQPFCRIIMGLLYPGTASSRSARKWWASL